MPANVLFFVSMHCAISVIPSDAAKASGVYPSRSSFCPKSSGFSLSTNFSTTLTCPARAAIWSGVNPVGVIFALTRSGFDLRESSIAFQLPPSNALIKPVYWEKMWAVPAQNIYAFSRNCVMGSWPNGNAQMEGVSRRHLIDVYYIS